MDTQTVSATFYHYDITYVNNDCYLGYNLLDFGWFVQHIFVQGIKMAMYRQFFLVWATSSSSRTTINYGKTVGYSRGCCV